MRVLVDHLRCRRPIERYRLRAERLGKPQQVDPAVAFALGEPEQLRRLDIDCRPVGIERIRHALAGTHELLGLLVRPDRDKDAVAREPGTRSWNGTARRAHRDVHAIRHAPQREFAQGHQVGLAEKPLDGGRDLIGDIDLAGLQPRDQVVRRKVDQLDFVRLFEYPVGHRLALAHARDLGNDVIQALEVLDIDGGPHVNAGIEDFLDVLPALGMTRRRIAAGQVGMRKLVDQQDGRSTAQRGIEVEFLADDVAIADGQRRQLLEPFHQPLGLDPAMRLDIADDDLAADCLRTPCRFQHRVSLADACGSAEENVQAAAPGAGLFCADLGEQLVRVGARVDHELAYRQSLIVEHRARD